MILNGNLRVIGAGEIQNLRPENLSTDPSSPVVGQVWFNTNSQHLKYFDGAEVHTIATGGDAGALELRVDTLVNALGVNEDGTLPSLSTSSYMESSTTLLHAIFALDSQIRANTDGLAAEVSAREAADTALQTELDTTQTGAGLEDNGTLAPYTGSNYLVSATSLRAATVALDGQAKTTADNLAAEITAREAADAVLQANIDAEEAARQAAVSTLTTNLADEVTRATNAEAAISAALTDEVTRATNAEAAIREDLDARVAGLSWKAPARVKSSAEITLSGLQTIDGVTLVDGDRVLVNNQSNQAENGVYVAHAGAWVRSTDMDQSVDPNEFAMAALFIEAGTVYGNTGWVQVEQVTALGTSNIKFVQFNGAAGITAGTGMTKDGNILNVNGGNGIQVDATEVSLDIIPTGGLYFVSGEVGIQGDGTSITISAAGIKVADVLTTEIADLRTDLTSETSAREAAIAAETSAREAAVAAETSAREAADTAIQAELDATQTGAGLNSDGTLAAFADANYIEAANSLRAALISLDTQANVNELAISAEASARAAADTALTSRLVNCFHVYEGGTASVNHTVTHNIGSRYCNVTVVDSNDEVIIPQSVHYNSATQLTVTFNAPITCRVVVSGLNVA